MTVEARRAVAAARVTVTRVEVTPGARAACQAAATRVEVRVAARVTLAARVEVRQKEGRADAAKEDKQDIRYSRTFF